MVILDFINLLNLLLNTLIKSSVILVGLLIQIKNRMISFYKLDNSIRNKLINEIRKIRIFINFWIDKQYKNLLKPLIKKKIIVLN